MPKVSRQKYRNAKCVSDLTINIAESEVGTMVNVDHLECKSQSPHDLEMNENGSEVHASFVNNEELYVTAGHDSESDLEFDNIPENVSKQQEEVNIAATIIQLLSLWAVTYNIPQVALNELLKILKSRIPELPNDSRTLLKTPRKIDLQVVEPGHYYHFGLKNCIEKLFLFYECFVDTIEVCINIDGLPLSKSSGSQLYPILCSVFDNKTVVNIVGIYHGYVKPKEANNLLKDFVNEAVELTTKGIVLGGRTYKFKVKALICDAPAKSYVMYTKNHNGYYSCSKCCIEGNYINNRLCFLETNNLVLRTHDSFTSKLQNEHHTGTSLMELIPNFDMIKDVPLDYMHLICLGVVRKLIVVLWSCGKPPHKLSFRQLSTISEQLMNQACNIPMEFNRKPRSLCEVKRWKATEFRQFLFYTGPVVLKNILNQDQYTNFLVLHTASTILANSTYIKQYLEYANSLMVYFVESFKTLYGQENVSHNIHNLLHICEDSERFGVLDQYSAFGFENYMQTLKRLVRKPHQALSQIIHRKFEEDASNSIINQQPIEPYPRALNEHNSGPLMHSTFDPQFVKLSFEYFTLSITEPNNFCCLKDNSIVCIRNFATSTEGLMLIGQKFLSFDNFYSIPCNSSDLGIYLVSSPGKLQSWKICDISYKCIKLDYQGKFVILPFLHLR